MKKHLFLVFALSFGTSVAQFNFTCGFDTIHVEKYTSDSSYRSYIDNMRAYIVNYIDGKESEVNPAPFTVPVVVHVVHPGDAYGNGFNISYEQIQR